MSNNDWDRFYAPRRLADLTPERSAADGAAAEQDIDVVLERTGSRRAHASSSSATAGAVRVRSCTAPDQCAMNKAAG